MKKSEVAELLTAIASTDNRTVGRLDIEMWFKILPGELTLANAQDALIRLRLETDDWLTPKHIVDRVTEVHRDRLQRAGTPPIPGDLTWRQERDWRVLWCDHVKNGLTPDDAATQASRSLNLPLELPTTTSEAIAAERKALVLKLAESKAAPKAKPENFKPKPKKPRTRWGNWARGTYVEENGDTQGHIVFSPDGSYLYHDGGPYGISIDNLTGDIEFWIHHIAGKGWGDSATLTSLARAWWDITMGGDDDWAWVIVKVSEAIDPEVEAASMNRAHPAADAS